MLMTSGERPVPVTHYETAIALFWSNKQDTKLTSITEVFSESETTIYP